VAVLLRSAADWIHDHSHLSHGACMVIVVVTLTAILVGNVYLFGVSFASQIDQLKSSIGQAREQILRYSDQFGWSRGLLDGNTSAVLSQAPGAVSGTIHFIGLFIVMLMVGLYAAANPDLYLKGFVRLFPVHLRRDVAATMTAIATALRWWLAGQMISMAVVGVLTTLGLWSMGVPLPFTLGFLTAVLNFIPNIGAILSAGLAALLGLTVSVHLAGYVLILYVCIQAFEAYLLTPMIQQRAVELPPALTITVQAIMGLLVGGLGLALAAPLTVVGIVLVRRFHLNGDQAGRRAA
jgi:predicted PurR-regulated permease PerM